MELKWNLSMTGYMGGRQSPRATWHGNGISSIMLENPLEVQVGCGMPVVPIRQFSEMPFVDRDAVGDLFATFVNSPFNHQNTSTSPPIAMRAYTKARVLRSMRIMEDDWDIGNHYHNWICSVYLKLSLLDEADMLFEKVYDGVCQDGGYVKNWIDGNLGASVNGDLASSGGATLQFTRAELLRARDTIVGHGFESERIVCYTTKKALTDLKRDCTSSGAFDSFQWLPVDGMAVVDGILMVSNSSRALQIADQDKSVAHSVMFVDGVSFGTVSDDTITVSARRLPNSMMQFYATHWTGGVIKNAGSICCIVHR